MSIEPGPSVSVIIPVYNGADFLEQCLEAVMASVIIPVYNGADFLERCLEAVMASDAPSYECIVVDDGSTDGSRRIAADFPMPVRIADISDGPRGPAFARNRGAELARGEILFFVDADVVLARGTLRRLAKTFSEQPALAAVFGSYDATPAAGGLVSQYRNLLHHFVHQNGNPEASTFWAGCGAIRRKVFERVGGFDERNFPRPSIEDIELGYRLKALGCLIRLDKELQGTHLKRWTFWSMIRTDVFCRAVPWSRLILHTSNMPADLNLKMGQRASFILATLACALPVLSGVRLEWLAASAAAILGVFALNRKLYLFFLRKNGVLFAVGCVALHVLYYLYSGLSYLYVWIENQLSRRATIRPLVALKSAVRSFLSGKS
jgi:glycosyltransferase involved in cell wall biosynthesis